MGAEILVESRGAVRVLRLNRPEALNALSQAMFEALRGALAAAAAEPSVRAVLLTGTGRAFCAGADLTDPFMGLDLPKDEKPRQCAETLDGLMNGLIRDIADMPVPVVTAVNGIAAGGGVGVALAGDLTIAAESARFKLGFVPLLGLVPDLGCTWQLVRRLGRARAAGAMLLDRDIPARQAADWGLIWAVAPDDALDAEALALAEELAAGPTGAQRALRTLLDAAGEHDLPAQLDLERDLQAARVVTAEAEEAITAFREKRRPDFARLGREA